MDKPGRLTDCFTELLSCVQSFRKSAGEKQPSYEPVRQEILRLLKESEEFPAKGLCSREDYDQARYAVCAWIDETVLAAEWTHKGRWRPELLQRLFYQSADAGEKFFERLSRLGVHQNEIREVYYLCLALGFEGRYCGSDGAPALEALKTHHLKLLFEGLAESPTIASLEKTRLFPEAYAPGSASKAARSWNGGGVFFTTAAIAGSTGLVLALFLIYRFSLLTLGDNILKAVSKG